MKNTTRQRRRSRSGAAVAGAAVAATVAIAFGFAAAGAADDRTDLARARQATARYHRVEVALAEGYIPEEECAEESGVGAMGFHYFNPEIAESGVVDPTKPPALLYMPTSSGRLRLVGAEWVALADQPASLFGQPFEGPFPGSGGMDAYSLHVWLWAHKPAGMFAGFNSRFTCNPQDPSSSPAPQRAAAR